MGQITKMMIFYTSSLFFASGSRNIKKTGALNARRLFQFGSGMHEYRTALGIRARLKAKRDAIKAAGGEAYAALLAWEREARALQRKRHPERVRAKEGVRRRTGLAYFKMRLLIKARRRGRNLGIEATVRVSDLEWPTHCPVLGIELDYATPRGERQANRNASPSIDRLDHRYGYVPGNVHVISWRANALKSNAMAEELEAVAQWMRLRSGLYCSHPCPVHAREGRRGI